MKNLTKPQAIAAYKRICRALGQQPHVDETGAVIIAKQGENLQRDWYASTPLLVRDYESWSMTTRWAVVAARRAVRPPP